MKKIWYVASHNSAFGLVNYCPIMNYIIGWSTLFAVGEILFFGIGTNLVDPHDSSQQFYDIREEIN